MRWRLCSFAAVRYLMALAGALVSLVATSAGAQSVGTMLVTDVRDAAGDVWAVWTSPFHTRPENYLLAGAAIGGSALVSFADVDIDNWFARNRNASAFKALKPVREGGILFSGPTVTPVAAGVYVIALAIKNEPLRDVVWGCVSSYGAESAVRTQILYRLVKRVRPDSSRAGGSTALSNSGDQYTISFGHGDWGEQSFPAGHTANVASCAAFLSRRFSMGYWAIVPDAVAAGVGVGRLVDRRHWTSDSVLGALYGYAIGNTIGARSKARAEKAAKTGASRDDNDGDGGLGGGTFFAAPEGDGRLRVGWTRAF